uniref:Uncharacterized protein n=1 Tax=Oryza sativa subsp. japonica TaxID=39947 RepID=Q5Z744_ORYSJ|nr:hypothetical protein [Oryza sativa Japonica Group]
MDPTMERLVGSGSSNGEVRGCGGTQAQLRAGGDRKARGAWVMWKEELDARVQECIVVVVVYL